MDTIRVKRGDTKRIIVDYGENLEQPEAEQWAIILRKPTKYRMAMTTMIVSGTTETRFDTEEYAKSFLVRQDNAPHITVDGRKPRRILFEDLFTFEEFEDVVLQIMEAIGEMNRSSEEEEESGKNS